MSRTCLSRLTETIREDISSLELANVGGDDFLTIIAAACWREETFKFDCLFPQRPSPSNLKCKNGPK